MRMLASPIQNKSELRSDSPLTIDESGVCSCGIGWGKGQGAVLPSARNVTHAALRCQSKSLEKGVFSGEGGECRTH
jgi:hypothetical protein